MISRATNGKRHEDRREHDARNREDDADVVLHQPWTQISLAAEEQDEHHARDDRRHGERQIDQRDQQLLSAKLKLADRPCRGDAEDQVRRHRDRGGRQRQRERRHRVGFADRRHVGRPSQPKRFGEDGDERHREKEKQKTQRDGGQQPPDGRGLGEAPFRIARASRLDVCHQCASFRLLQPCSALTVSSSVNEISSMTTAMAVAPGVVVLLELGDDQQRRNLGAHRHVARNEDDRSVFAHGSREGEREAGEPCRVEIGKDDARQDVPSGSRRGWWPPPRSPRRDPR